jgi:tRNA(fMet)-specific endonuclease VapC
VGLKRLVDTSAYVALKRGHPGVARQVRKTRELPFSVVVYGELLLGFRLGSRYEQNLDDLEEFLDHPAITLLHVNPVTADRFGRIAANLRRAGTPIPTNDIWIAAHAMESGAELITLDRHFEHIPGLAVNVLAPR